MFFHIDEEMHQIFHLLTRNFFFLIITDILGKLYQVVSAEKKHQICYHMFKSDNVKFGIFYVINVGNNLGQMKYGIICGEALNQASAISP